MSDSEDLGKFIDESKPYGRAYGELEFDEGDSVTWGSDGRPNPGAGLNWTFPNANPAQNPVRKALRIKYRYRGADNNWHEQYLLVGYEGAGSDD